MVYTGLFLATRSGLPDCLERQCQLPARLPMGERTVSGTGSQPLFRQATCGSAQARQEQPVTTQSSQGPGQSWDSNESPRLLGRQQCCGGRGPEVSPQPTCYPEGVSPQLMRRKALAHPTRDTGRAPVSNKLLSPDDRPGHVRADQGPFPLLTALGGSDLQVMWVPVGPLRPR